MQKQRQRQRTVCQRVENAVARLSDRVQQVQVKRRCGRVQDVVKAVEARRRPADHPETAGQHEHEERGAGAVSSEHDGSGSTRTARRCLHDQRVELHAHEQLLEPRCHLLWHHRLAVHLYLLKDEQQGFT